MKNSADKSTDLDSSHSFNFPQEEEKILNFWEKHDVFTKTLEKTKNGKPYIFYDGPPFATGLPHHGHLVGSTLKDIIPRFFTMKGYYVSRRFGWDCHGLPVEHEIDKSLKMSAQDAVAKLGVKAYNDQCRSIVQRYTKEWQKTIKRIGRWVDFDNDYKTMDVSFMESVWWVFHQLWEKGLIYQSTKVMPFSTSLGTVLSNFEAGSNYQMVQDPAVTVLFALEPRQSDDPAITEYVAAWTTTPWTLPSNLGLCVNAEITYVKVKNSKGQIFYIAQDRYDSYHKKDPLEQLEVLPGKNLVGRQYRPIFNYFQDLKKQGAFQIHSDDYVTTDSGTGIVHLAPAFGEDDNRVLKHANMQAEVCPVDNQGKFTKEVSHFSGMHVKDADKPIIQYLKEHQCLVEQSTIDHSYPLCPRSHTPLIYKAIPSWYIHVEKIKDDIIRANDHIHWVPDHLKFGRFGKWLEGARDWAVSRNRVWGTPIPIWYNEDSQKYYCISSKAELEEKTGQTIDDLHRENVDNLTFTIPGEKGVYKRIPEVLDCWFESGSMPYAQLHYPFENQKLFENNFPAEFIAEGLDQTRGWFYTLTVLAAALYQKPAFKNVIVNGLVLAADGKKMSKSLRNYTPPDELMDKYGADALRLFLINSGLVRGEDLKFSDDGVKDMVRRVLLPWYNSYKFFATYAKSDNWSMQQISNSTHILDQWILSELQTLIHLVNKEMNEYRLYNVVPHLFGFIENLTNWYIRLNRKRFWSEEKDMASDPDKNHAYQTLYKALHELSLMMAPFTPFLSENLYLGLQDFDSNKQSLPPSVHLCDFPSADEKGINKDLETAVKVMQEIILLGRQKRVQSQIKVKTPLKTLTVVHREKELLSLIKPLVETIKTELNVKEIIFDQREQDYIKLFAKPNSPVLGKKLGKQFRIISQEIAKLSTDDLLRFEKEKTLELSGLTLTHEDLILFREPLEGKNALANEFITIDLDCRLDQDLIDQGTSREIINRIQKTRKQMQLNVADRIHISFVCSKNLEGIITRYQKDICSETLCQKVSFVNNVNNGHTHNIDNETLEVFIEVL